MYTITTREVVIIIIREIKKAIKKYLTKSLEIDATDYDLEEILTHPLILLIVLRNICFEASTSG